MSREAGRTCLSEIEGIIMQSSSSPASSAAVLVAMVTESECSLSPMRWCIRSSALMKGT
eukprot:CAMPEP_0115520294 /NCGR_PEP_ID=MMETSP0271-20121206/78903_1 /TAXON_ID=71861 /ORGANISM="Scrippsiella trochoidea, Strain CCMP3099" /LENGTH=58 /DNA_ID=CAMNT_0002951383 /DNA_START=56 /DNA_END=232 /DNA_ORIENTATION=+